MGGVGKTHFRPIHPHKGSNAGVKLIVPEVVAKVPFDLPASLVRQKHDDNLQKQIAAKLNPAFDPLWGWIGLKWVFRPHVWQILMDPKLFVKRIFYQKILLDMVDLNINNTEKTLRTCRIRFLGSRVRISHPGGVYGQNTFYVFLRKFVKIRNS